MSDCIFCKIAAGEIAADLVHQDDEVVAFRDITPQAPTHILVIPRRHIATLLDTTAEEISLLGRLQQTAVEIARSEGLEERGFRLVTNCLEEAGQSVFHLHLHLLGGRRLSWPPG
jgi:histidine triad (HIT) family protein